MEMQFLLYWVWLYRTDV